MPEEIRSVKAAKAAARRRLRELESQRESTINRAVEALAKQRSSADQYHRRLVALHAEADKRRDELEVEAATAAQAVVDDLGVSAAATVLGVAVSDLRRLLRAARRNAAASAESA